MSSECNGMEWLFISIVELSAYVQSSAIKGITHLEFLALSDAHIGGGQFSVPRLAQQQDAIQFGEILNGLLLDLLDFGCHFIVWPGSKPSVRPLIL